jgi:hypothetical protein
MDELRSSSIMDQGYGNSYKKVLKDRRLTDKAKLIHCYLCSYAGGGTTAFPSVSLICFDLDINEGTYYEHMLYLKAYGYITIEQNQDVKGLFQNNIYTIEQFPEKYENEEYKNQIETMMKKRKVKNDKARKKKPYTDNPSTDENIPSVDNPSTDNQGTNNNSSNIILLSLWDDVKKRIKKELKDSPAYDEFIKPIDPIEFENDTMLFIAPSDWHRIIIDARYRSIIEMCLKEICKKEINIVLRI